MIYFKNVIRKESVPVRGETHPGSLGYERTILILTENDNSNTSLFEIIQWEFITKHNCFMTKIKVFVFCRKKWLDL